MRAAAKYLAISGYFYFNTWQRFTNRSSAIGTRTIGCNHRAGFCQAVALVDWQTDTLEKGLQGLHSISSRQKERQRAPDALCLLYTTYFI